MAVEPKPYLEYLDKEMFIMGILSAFSVAVATLPVEQVLSEKKSPVSQLFIMRDAHVVAGILLALLAAFLFLSTTLPPCMVLRSNRIGAITRGSESSSNRIMVITGRCLGHVASLPNRFYSAESFDRKLCLCWGEGMVSLPRHHFVDMVADPPLDLVWAAGSKSLVLPYGVCSVGQPIPGMDEVIKEIV